MLAFSLTLPATRAAVVPNPASMVRHAGEFRITSATAFVVDPGDGAVVEEPHYPGAAIPFEAVGARLLRVPVDAGGLDPASLPPAAERPRLAYVTPCHQFPSGVIMPLERRLALLINPFYPKDAHASFGKHVLTPTLALTSVAGATPREWTVRYWDENLLQGPPPGNPTPEVVGITVHLTFAERAYALAEWYRAGGARVPIVNISGGTEIYNQRAIAIFADNLRRYLTGAPLLNLVDRVKGY